MIQSIIDKVLRPFPAAWRAIALTLILCATGQAWAVSKPLAVWNGDFANADERGGYTIDLNGNSVRDGILSIDNAAGTAGGVKFTGTAAKGYLSTVAALSNIPLNSAAQNIRIFYSVWNTLTYPNLLWYGTDSAAYAYGRACIWGANGSGRDYDSNSDVLSLGDANRHYFGFRYVNKGNGEANTTGGGTVYLDKNKICYKDPQYVETVTSFSVGGLWDKYSTTGFFTSTGMKVHYLAVLYSKDENDISYWSLTAMTSVENATDGGTITGGDDKGINLAGGTVTVSGAKKAAAVFVQEDTKLKFSSAGSLTIGGGAGPLYIAEGKTLTIDFENFTGEPTAKNPLTIVSGKVFGKTQITFLNVPADTIPTIGDDHVKLVYNNLYSAWKDNGTKVVAWRQNAAKQFHQSTVSVVDTSDGSMQTAKAMDATSDYNYNNDNMFNDAANAAALIVDSPSYLGQGYVTIDYFTLGGLLVTAGEMSMGQTNTGDRQLKLGDKSGTKETYYTLAQSITLSDFKSNSKWYGTSNVTVYDGAVLTLPASGIALAGNVSSDNNLSATLKMVGGGKIYCAGTITATPYNGTDSYAITLDYSGLDADRSTPFIDAELAINSSTIFKFPDNAEFPYPVAKTVTGAPEGDMTFYVGGTRYTRPLTFEDGKACPEGESTATFTGGAGTWAGLTWDLKLPDSYTRKVVATETGTIALGSVSGYPKVIFDVDSNKTLTLTGTLTADEIEFTGGGTIVCSAADTLQGTIKGNANITIEYPNHILPTTGANGDYWTDSDWRGTLVLKNCGSMRNTEYSSTPAQDRVPFEDYGSVNSKIKAPGFKGYAATTDSTKICNAELVIDADMKAGDVVTVDKHFEFNHGDGSTNIFEENQNAGFRFAKLSGDGLLMLDGATDFAQYIFCDVKDFAGSVHITRPVSGGRKSYLFGAPADWPVLGSAYPANLVIKHNSDITSYSTTVASGKTWTIPAGIIIENGATLTLSVSSTITALSPRSDGTLSVPTGTATLSSVNPTDVGNSVMRGFITANLNIGTGATLQVTDTTVTELTIPADATAGTGTYVNNGTLDLSGCTALTKLHLALGSSRNFSDTIAESNAKILLPSTCTEICWDIGEGRDLSQYTLADVAGKTISYYATETATEYATGTFSVSNVPGGCEVWMIRVNGNVLKADKQGDTTTHSYNGGSAISGTACWHEWDFEQMTNLQAPDYANKLKDTGKHSVANSEVSEVALSTTSTLDDSNYTTYYSSITVSGQENKCSLSSAVQPYADCGSFGTAWSAAVRCTMPTVTGDGKVVAVAFGDTTSGILGLAAKAGGVVEVFNWTSTGDGTYVPLAQLKVEAATTDMHIYALAVRQETESETTKNYVTIYRDGEYIHDAEFHLTGTITEFKVGDAIYTGGRPASLPAAASTVVEEAGAVDYIRLYDSTIDSSIPETLSKRRPFVSAKGPFVRTVSGEATWSSANAWTKTNDTVPGTHYNTPDVNNHVTLTVDDTTIMSVNLGTGSDVTYDTLIIEGDGAMSISEAADNKAKISAETVVVRTDVTVAYDAVDFHTALVAVDPGEGHVIKFDFRNYPFDKVSEATTITLAGNVPAKAYDPTCEDRYAVLLPDPLPGYIDAVNTGADWVLAGGVYSYVLRITLDHTPGADVYYGGNYISADMDGKAGSGRVFVNSDLRDQTSLLPGDVMVISSSWTSEDNNAWIADTFHNNIKVTRTTLNLMPGEHNNPILNNRTITVESGSTLNLKKYDAANGPRTFNFGALTLNGPGTINFVDDAAATSLAGNAAITVAEGKTLTLSSNAGSFTGSVSGSGAVQINSITGSINFNKYGSMVILGTRGMNAWLVEDTSPTGRATVNPTLRLDGNLDISAMSNWGYTFAKITGEGNFTIPNSASPSSFTISEIENYTGTIINNHNGIEGGAGVKVGKVSLASAPAKGDKLLAVSGSGAVTIESVCVNNSAVDNLIWERKCPGTDAEGIYVTAVISRSADPGEAVSEIAVDTDETSITVPLGASYTGTVVVPPNVSSLVTTGTNIDTSKVKVMYGLTDITGAFTVGGSAGNVTIALNSAGIVNEIPVQPVLETSTPMAFEIGLEDPDPVPVFSVKTIPGLWYAIEECATPNGTFSVPSEADLVMAEGTSLTVSASEFTGTVKYYKVKTAAKESDLTTPAVAEP